MVPSAGRAENTDACQRERRRMICLAPAPKERQIDSPARKCRVGDRARPSPTGDGTPPRMKACAVSSGFPLFRTFPSTHRAGLVIIRPFAAACSCSSQDGSRPRIEQSHLFRRRSLEDLRPLHDIFKRYWWRLAIPMMNSVKQDLDGSVNEMEFDRGPECSCSGS
jgi:hypothetical protein